MDSRSSWDNFLYFAARIFFTAYPEERAARDREEEERGVVTIDTESPLDVGIQIIDLAQLDPAALDSRIMQPARFPPPTRSS